MNDIVREKEILHQLKEKRLILETEVRGLTMNAEKLRKKVMNDLVKRENKIFHKEQSLLLQEQKAKKLEKLADEKTEKAWNERKETNAKLEQLNKLLDTINKKEEKIRKEIIKDQLIRDDNDRKIIVIKNLQEDLTDRINHSNKVSAQQHLADKELTERQEKVLREESGVAKAKGDLMAEKEEWKDIKDGIKEKLDEAIQIQNDAIRIKKEASEIKTKNKTEWGTIQDTWKAHTKEVKSLKQAWAKFKKELKVIKELKAKLKARKK